MDELIPLKEQSIRASEVEAVVLADSRAVMVTTKSLQNYVAVYAYVKDAKAAKAAFEARWHAWRDAQ